MRLTKKELQDLKNKGTCEVIRLQKYSKKAIKDNDLCDDYLRCENKFYNSYINKMPISGLIVTDIQIIKVSANDIHVPKDF